jgi:hypothetical protein
MIKIITFCIGVDVLGFPLFHQHRLKFRTESKYIIGYDKISGTGDSIGAFYNTQTGERGIIQRKHLDKE